MTQHATTSLGTRCHRGRFTIIFPVPRSTLCCNHHAIVQPLWLLIGAIPRVPAGDYLGLLDRATVLDGPRQAHELGMRPGQRGGRERALTFWLPSRRVTVPYLLGQHVAFVSGIRYRLEP